ncbi:molybdenum ABC transporter substrate-binding protein [Pseudomonas aeruginosa]|uniref:ABC transporter substrate-binding protein n=3 Tax=Pseudomonas TaxID=286 RepID=A0ABD7K7B3_PSEAI|nr:emolybdenum ABC transporter substrate-binding protein [Pseudomonas aeruginosa PA7]KSC94673.2 molybdenum ABC transporter substrate-binding protein [Pseudomonas aeruginosa]NQB01736.1 substrate-binding domain-containing protein [Pseudomonas paraeruginosa]KSD28978.2 molybdenum ABC transporter substrate-binding protein [Pseudomonas aeruginosa]KSG50538.2 molybdenum ABC transporter substrate-binding protein [Pseudomonas aeruginosa]
MRLAAPFLMSLQQSATTTILAALCIALSALAGSPPAAAAELRVITSGGFSAAYRQLAPRFSEKTGDTLHSAYGPSMGHTPQAIPQRLEAGEKADALIMVGYALDELIRQGKVRADSRVELADSRIGLVVRSGAARPPIGNVAQLRQALLAARSVAYSDSASGRYVQERLFKRLGIERQMRDKARMIPRIPVAEVVADGQYELGLQQVAELLPVPGVDFVGRLPEAVQSVTRFAAGIPVNAEHPRQARALLRYLASPEAQAMVRASGLDSLAQSAPAGDR